MTNKYVGLTMLAIACLLTTKSTNADMSTLQDLLNGGSLMSQGTVYSNFELIADIGTSAIDPSSISVETLSGNDGLSFFSDSEFSLSAGSESIIFQLGFDAQTSGLPWVSSGVDLSNGNSNVSGFGLVDVFNSVTDSNNNLLAETNAFLDPGFGLSALSDSSLLAPPQSDVNLVSSFSLFADAGSPTSIDSYQVTLAIPEPANAVALLLLSTLTIIRRTR